jgi:glycosyltransferase involved in cell wall biosynthesis
MNNPPLVSILINNYNYGQFLPAAIESALSQTYDRVEVVVVDDGSQDDSRAIIGRYGDRIIAVMKPNGGQASAFNAGFAASQGDVLCFLDADDYCHPHKARQLVDQLGQHPAAGWWFHELTDVDAAGQVLAQHRAAGITDCQAVDYRHHLLTGQAITTIFPATSGLCFTRQVLQQVLPMPPQLLISADNYLRLAAASLAPGLLIPEPLAVHRIHGKNAFEFRTDTAFLHAETNIKTAYYLRQHFPQTQPFVDRLFSHAIGCLAGSTQVGQVWHIPESQQYFQDYFSPLLWCQYSPRILYNYLKARLSALPPLQLSPSR